MPKDYEEPEVKPCANPVCRYDAEPGYRYCVECEQMREDAKQEAAEGYDA